jgi:hypothetical protein
MNVQSSLATAEKALSDLARAVRALQHSFGNTLDMRRLMDDVSRIEVSLEALKETAPAGASAQQHKLEVIPDQEYDYDFWRDAEGEGLGVHDHRAP